VDAYIIDTIVAESIVHPAINCVLLYREMQIEFLCV